MKTSQLNTSPQTETAILGGGCFWGVEDIFMKQHGVLKTCCGYAGGPEPTNYQLVCTGKTGHAEVVKVEFDPTQLSFEKILEVFFRLHDPTTLNQQGPDHGSQYRSVIFTLSESQEKTAHAFIAKCQAHFNHSIVTEVVSYLDFSETQNFFEAEEYHQKYFQKNGGHGCHYLRPSLD